MELAAECAGTFENFQQPAGDVVRRVAARVEVERFVRHRGTIPGRVVCRQGWLRLTELLVRFRKAMGVDVKELR